MKILNKKEIVPVMLVLVLGIAGSAYYFYSNVPMKSEDLAKKQGIDISHAEYPEWSSSPAGILDNTANVFIGTVISQDRNEMRSSGPATLYTVQSILDIKGKTAGSKVTLVQIGVGYSGDNFYAREGDVSFSTEIIKPEDALFKVGATYLFAAQYDPTTQQYGVSIPPYDSELITDQVLPVAKLNNLALGNSRVQKFLEIMPLEPWQHTGDE